MPTLRPPVLLAAAALLLGSPAGADDASFEERILWWNAERTEALFIPEAILSTTDIEDLPLHEHGKHRLRFVLDVRLDPLSEKPDCFAHGTPSPPGSAPGALDLEHLLAAAPVVVTGRAVAVVDGFDFWNGSVGRLAYLVVEEVLAGKAEGVEAGGTVAYGVSGGQARVEGVRICNRSVPGFHQPEVGDEMLLAGSPWPEEPTYLTRPFAFPIDSGEVQPQPYAEISTASPRPLEQVASEVRRIVREEQQGGTQ